MRLVDKRMIAILLVTAVVLCTTGMAINAYYSTTVESLVLIRVVASDQALLTLEPGNDPVGNMVVQKDGVLCFNFSFNALTEQYYQFTQLFYVRNNSADDIEFTVENTGIKYISIKPPASGDDFVEGGINKGYFHPLPSGQSIAVEVSFDVPAYAEAESIEGNLLVKAQVVD